MNSINIGSELAKAAGTACGFILGGVITLIAIVGLLTLVL